MNKLNAFRARMLFDEIKSKGSLSKLNDIDMTGFRFCIEGYPRSANTTVSFLLLPQLEQRFGTPDVVIHHTHNLKTVKFCRLMKVPMLLLIREPREAVISNYIYHQGKVSMARLINKWLEYYRYVAKHREELLLCSFDSATNQINEVIANVNDFYGIELQLIEDLPLRMQMMKRQYKSRSKARRGDEYYTTYPLPDDNRASLKSDLVKQLPTDLLSKAERLYEHLIVSAI